MKKLPGIVFILFFCIGSALAQDSEPETLLGDIKAFGGFGGPYLKLGSVGTSPALWAGGFAGWVINHSLVFGGAGFGLLSNISVEDAQGGGAEQELVAGYGGVWLEYHPGWKKMLHFSFATLIGGGATRARDIDEPDSHGGDHNGDPFFVLEPVLQLNLNVVRVLRIGISAGYRYTLGVKTGSITDAEMRGATFGLYMKYGKF